MPPKKKGGAKKGGAKGADIDDTTEKLYRMYRRKLNEYGATMPRRLVEKFEEIRDEKNPGRLTEVILWEHMGPMGVKALFDSLREQNYEFVKQIRLW
jgi:hypothetical protein